MSVLDGVQLHLVDTVQAAGELMTWLSTQSTIALDVETTGLSPERDRVRLVQVGGPRDGWAIPFDRWGGVVEELVGRYEGEIICHSSFDDVMLRTAEGIELDRRRIHDTRLQAHVLDSTGPLALKPLCDRRIDPRFSAGQQILEDAMRAQGWTWETVPLRFGPYWQYGALDTVGTWHLDAFQRPLVRAEAPAAYDLEMAVQWVTCNMERYGARIDRAYCQERATRLRAYVDQAAAWVKSTYGIHPGSDAAVAQVLVNLGFNLVKKTPNGSRFSVDKFVLESIDHPLAQTVLARRQAEKLAGTYLEPYLRMADRNDLIHPRINTVGGLAKTPGEAGGRRGVRTGRMSMDTPNLQNVPIRTNVGKMIRDAFFPRDEGRTWVKCDADQIEMRILAHLAATQCRERSIVDAFLQPGDFFVNMARQIFAEPNFQKSDPRRQMVKNAGYAKIYGAGIPKFALTAGISEDVAGPFMRQFDQSFPGGRAVAAWVEGQSRLHRAEEGSAYVRSPLTNRRHTADAGREYALTNYLIQGTAAEVLKMKIVEADQAGIAEYFVFPVHDEIDADVPDAELDDFLATLNDVVNDDKLLAVPVTWSVETGPRWGSCT